MYEPQLPQYLRDLLEEMRRHLKPGRRGKLLPPTPEEDVEFWRMVDLFLDSVRREGLDVSMKRLAEMLDVGYQSLLNRYKMWEEAKKELGELASEPPALQVPGAESGGGEVTIIPPQPQRQPAQPQPPASPQPQAAPSPPLQGQPSEVIEIHPQVQLAMARAAIEVMKKRGEQITKEYAEELIKLGLHVFDRYAEWCYKHDFKNLKECVDHVFQNFDSMEQENEELKARLGELEERYEHLKRFAQRLLRKTLGQPDPERVIGVVGVYIDRIMGSCLDPDTAYAIAYRLLDLLDRLLNAYYQDGRIAAL